MKKIIFLFSLICILAALPAVAQQRPYISLDINFTASLKTYPTHYKLMGKLPDNSFVMTRWQGSPSGTPGVWARLDSSWLIHVSANGVVLWETNLGQFMPLRVLPGPDSNITVMGYSLIDVPVTSGWPQVYSTYFGKVLDTQGNVTQATAAVPVINSHNCDLIIYGLWQNPASMGSVLLPEGNFVVHYDTYDTTKSAVHDETVYNIAKISPLGQMIWNKKMPYHSTSWYNGLALLATGNIVYNGVNFQKNDSWDIDNATTVLSPNSTILGDKIFPCPGVNQKVPRTPYTAVREGFAPASNSGFWSWRAGNGLSPGGNEFPLVYQSETCDTLFAGLVPFMGEDSLWSRWVNWGIPTPGDNGFLVMVMEAAPGTSHNDHYLLKLRSDGSVHWRSEQGGISPNMGQNGYFTTDGDLIQLNLTNMRLTRWHIPVGTGVAEAVAQPGLSVSPNPVKDVLTATFSAPIAGQITLAITDLSGRQFLSQPMQAVAGANTGQLSVAELAPGMYVLSAAGATGTAAQTVFVKE